MALPSNLPQTANIQGFWKLDEESGTRADETDNGNTLADNNTVLYDTGKIVNAAKFVRAQSEALSIADATQAGLDITGEIAICAWIERDSDTGGYESIVSKFDYNGGAGPMCYFLRVTSDDKLNFMLTNDGTSITQVIGTDNISVGSLVHVAATLNQTTDLIQLYINGIAVDDPVAYATDIFDGSAAFIIGSEVGGDFFDGLIDEVIVWNTCLTAAEVLQVKNITAYTYGGGGILNWFFMKEAFDKGKKYFKNKNLYLPNQGILIPEVI